MKLRKKIVIFCSIFPVIFAAALLLISSYTYVTRYRITDIDSALSADGQYQVLFQAVGEPDFPFGDSHARILLKHGGRTITKYKFDVANDGAILYPDNWRVSWEKNCVKIIISGEEQPDRIYRIFFDGAVREG